MGNRRFNARGRRGHRLLLESLESRTLLHAAGGVSGFVFIDSDRDGTRDGNELGVPGIVIELTETASSSSDPDHPGSAVQRSLLTDRDGRYTFAELEPGSYTLSKRQAGAILNNASGSQASATAATNGTSKSITLTDGQTSENNDFAESGLRPQFINILWFFASTATSQLLRETIAVAEEQAGNMDLAESIRAGGSELPTDTNSAPIASNDTYNVTKGQVLTVATATGVLANDSDQDGDALTASIVSTTSHGTLTLNADGSFSYTPTADFTGDDSFTYRAGDATSSSNLGTVTIHVNAPPDPGSGNTPFPAVTTGPFDAMNLLGVRTDLLTGAPAILRDHVTTTVDYSTYSNPPTYGPHHAFQVDSQNRSITPRPTGVYDTVQPDEDLVHNLEHGHVWISYDPALISSTDLAALKQFVIDGGTDTGVILTPRPKNDKAIAVASWAHLLTLDSLDKTQIRNFIVTNRGHAPEGFIPSGQKTAASETLNDNLPHAT